MLVQDGSKKAAVLTFEIASAGRQLAHAGIFKKSYLITVGKAIAAAFNNTIFPFGFLPISTM